VSVPRDAPTPSISVALVTRNRVESLVRCLASWRRQSRPPDEIVISDDSDPAQAVRVEAVARRHGCRYIAGPRRGLYANRNRAALACTGTHILSADDDHTHPVDYLAVIAHLAATDPSRIWIFGERWPDQTTEVACPPELHRSGFGCEPSDPSRCAAIADGATLYPRRVFDSGLRYDETYPFGGLWYLWGKLLASRGWRISFSDRTFVWHHFWDDLPRDEGRLADRNQLRQQLLATTYVQFVNALWIERSTRSLAWATAYAVRRMVRAESIVHFRVRSRLPVGGTAVAFVRALQARRAYSPR
jgi:glycosyltransferase involved in cell wall biosynthesis